MAGGAGITLGRLAEALKATLDAEPDRIVTGVAPLAGAGPDHLAYVADRHQLEAARASRAGAFLVPAEVKGLPAPTLSCRDPRRALAAVLGLFYPAVPPAAGVDASAHVSPDARIDATASVGALAVVERGASIGARARIGPLAYVGADVQIGEGSILHPHAVVYDGCRLGRDVIVHAGAVIGADGFGFIPSAEGHLKIPQVGTVVIEDDVEIGANTTIDRATLGETIVRRGTKLDNLIHIGHNTEVGERCLMAAQSGIAGSSRLGKLVMLGGQAGIADHVEIGDGAMLTAQAGVSENVDPGARLFGTWARPVPQARRIWIAEEKLPELLRTVKRLEERLVALEARLARPRKARR